MERAIELYGEALDLVPEGDAARRRTLKMRQAVAIQAHFQTPDAERRLRPG